MWGENRIFASDELQAEVWDRGYALRPLVSRETAAELLSEIEGIAERCGVPFDATDFHGTTYHLGVFSDNDRYRREINALARDRLGPLVEDMMVDYRLMYSTVFIKPPGAGGIAAHIDDTMQIDLSWPGITAWCALNDTMPENGTLEFVPGSHSLYDEPYSVTTPPPFAAAIGALDRLAVPVPAAAGEVIFFDRSILHRSNDNATEKPRVALPMGLVKKDRPVVFIYPGAEGGDTLDCMRMDSEDRDRHSTADVLSGKVHTEVLESIPTRQRSLSQDETLALLRHGDDLRSRRTDVDEVLQAFAEGRQPAGSCAAAPKSFFKDPANEAAFSEDGYFRCPMLTTDEADRFLEEVFALSPGKEYAPNTVLGEEMPYHLTEFDEDADYKRRFRSLADRYFAPVVDELLVDYRILTATMFIKPAGAAPVPLHNDWQLQEDALWPTIYLWCPLGDVTEADGALRFLAGSHGVLDFVYGPLGAPPYLGAEHVLEPQMTAVPVAAGEGIVFDAGILHGSLANQGDKARYAVRLACIPSHRRGVLHMQSRDHADVTETWSMDTDEFFAHSGKELFDGNLKTSLLRKTINPRFALNAEEIIHLVAEGANIRAGRATMRGALESFRAEQAAAQQQANESSGASPGTVGKETPFQREVRRFRRRSKRIYRMVRSVIAADDAAPASHEPQAAPAPEPQEENRLPAFPPPHGGHDFAAYPADAGEWTPFGDDRLDRDLRQQGFCTFPFLAPGLIDALAEAVEQAEQRIDRSNVHIDTDFHLSAFNNDATYKERLFNAVWDQLEGAMTTILPDYEPLVINLFDKPVSDRHDPVPIHQNPSFVNEPEHRSISLWIPFADVDRDNGTVGVLPGSHSRFNRMRSGNMAHEDVFADVQERLEGELFVPIVLAKGEALALDDSIVHWSYPNVSDRPRKAVQLIMVPRGVPHIYYFYDDASPGEPMMDLYAVDRHFFFGFNCKARPETLTKIDRVPYAYRRIAEPELLAGLKPR